MTKATEDVLTDLVGQGITIERELRIRILRLEEALKEIIEFSEMPPSSTIPTMVAAMAGQLGTVNGIARRALEKS